MKTYLSWLLTGLSLLGVVLNIKKRKSCFMIWIFTNGGWAIYFLNIQEWASVTLFGLYFILAVWGLTEWKKGEEKWKA